MAALAANYGAALFLAGAGAAAATRWPSNNLAEAPTFPFRLPGSPYPAPAGGANASCGPVLGFGPALSGSQRVTLQTLQGGLARDCPRLFRVGDDAGMADQWLRDLQVGWGVAVDLSHQGDFGALLRAFASDIAGYVTYSSHVADSVNVAVSFCAAMTVSGGRVAVAVELGDVVAFQAALPSAPLLRAAENLTYADVLAAHPLNGSAGGLNNRVFNLQDPAKADCLVDWATFAGALHYWDETPSLSSPTSRAVFSGVAAPAAFLGWGTNEGGSVDALSGVGLYIHASDFSHNLATLSAFSAGHLQQDRGGSGSNRGENPQHAHDGIGAGPPPAAPPREQRHVDTTSSNTTTTTTAATSKHTVAFLMTDGDNVQWLLNDFATPGGDWFGAADRGSVPLGWTMSPAMGELAPSVLAAFYRNATPGADNFVAAPSGVGYAIPGKFPSSTGGLGDADNTANVTAKRVVAGGSGGASAGKDDPSLEAFCQLTSAFMAKTDLRVVNYIADGDCSPGCTDPMLAQGQVDAVVLYYGNDYVGGDGGVTWSSSGKPVVRGRAPAMWGDNDPIAVTRHLRFLPTDPRNPQSYSLVPVHVWTHTVADVINASALLGSDFFDVVTPEELVGRLQANVFHDCASAPTATGSYSDTCSGGTDTCGALRDIKCAAPDGGTVPTAFFDHTVCNGSKMSNCFGRLLCDGDTCTCPAGKATGSFAASCTGCRDVCGLLVDCQCGGGATQEVFDHTVCDGGVVADCHGALVCQGQPCQ